MPIFGKKWLHLFRGPMWQYEEEESHTFIDDALLGIDLTLDEPVATLQYEGEESCTVLEDALLESGIDLTLDESVWKVSSGIEVLHIDGDCIVDAVFEQDSNNISATESNVTPESNQVNESPVSTLWTHVSNHQQQEIQQGSSPQEMEHFHQITPAVSQRKQQNPNIYNPLKVR